VAISLTYHWRSLFARRTTTTLTVLVVAAVVSTLGWILGFAAALRSSLSVASDDRKLIVISRGATSETTSALPIADFNKLSQLADLARAAQSGEALLSPEMIVQVSLPRLRDGGRTQANVAVRGVTARAFDVHRTVRPLGPVFSTGAQEVIVGQRTAQQFGGLRIGDTIDLGYGNNRGYKVVGYFTAEDGPLESEIWGYLPSLMNAYNRTMYSSAGLRLRDGADAAAVVTKIAGPAFALTAQTERDYWNKQSALIDVYMGIVAALVAVMALAAVFAIANTMFAAVAGRTREIAMLRTIGFARRRILAGFVLEAVLLALLGGLLGCLVCTVWLKLVGQTKDMYGATSFTTLAFDIRLTPAIAAVALTVAAVVGACGAIIPAWRAARLQVISALREA
jgi:ABC-type lipoprotein release transport system permease subunit